MKNVEHIKFSFIVPVYNVESYLPRCLDSLLNQDYNNFEIICVNDGSNDSSLEILNDYSAKYSNIYIVNQENKGLGEARNTGVKYATGNYIWFIDSDDWIVDNSLLLLAEFIRNNGEKDMIVFNCYHTSSIQQRGRIFKAFWKVPSILNPIEYVRLLLDGQGLFAAWNRIYRRDFYVDSKFSFPKGFYEDVSQICLSLKAKSIGYFDEELYNYFYNENSIMRQMDYRILDSFEQTSKVEKSICLYHTLFYDIEYFKLKMLVDTFQKISNTDNDVYEAFFKKYKKAYKFSLSFLCAKYAPIKSKIKLLYYSIFILLKTYIYVS